MSDRGQRRFTSGRAGRFIALLSTCAHIIGTNVSQNLFIVEIYQETFRPLLCQVRRKRTPRHLAPHSTTLGLSGVVFSPVVVSLGIQVQHRLIPPALPLPSGDVSVGISSRIPPQPGAIWRRRRRSPLSRICDRSDRQTCGPGRAGDASPLRAVAAADPAGSPLQVTSAPISAGKVGPGDGRP